MNRVIKEFVVNVIGSSKILNGKLRSILYKIGGYNFEDVGIRSGCTFRGEKIFIKRGSFLNNNVFISGNETISIGCNVYIAFDVLITTNSHEIGTESQRATGNIYSPVTIEDGVWIGARSTILPGVVIKKGCVIAAGSVVNRDCEPNGLYAGVPAKRIKDL